MKTKFILFTMFLMFQASFLSAQTAYAVATSSSDLSENLDLEAIANIFGRSTSLRDFESQINDYRNGISNLDLNNDGYVDYLRVVESYQNRVRVVLIQAVLGPDEFQDVATIYVVGTNYSNTVVQIVGNPYIYGPDYVIQPSYGFAPPLYSYFWNRLEFYYFSPYYWGYYPSYYRYHRIMRPMMFNRHMYVFYHNHPGSYRYPRRPNIHFGHNSIYTRRDYAVRYPSNSFDRRNANRGYSNKNGIVNRRDDSRSVRNPVNARRNTNIGNAGSNDSRRQNSGFNNSTRRSSNIINSTPERNDRVKNNNAINRRVGSSLSRTSRSGFDSRRDGNGAERVNDGTTGHYMNSGSRTNRSVQSRPSMSNNRQVSRPAINRSSSNRVSIQRSPNRSTAMPSRSKSSTNRSSSRTTSRNQDKRR